MYQNVKRTCKAIVFAHFEALSLSSPSSLLKLPVIVSKTFFNCSALKGVG